jgi:aryl-alcohol dehydrogenase-like predicted oxidoreductase
VNYRRVGKSGLRVSEIGLGTWDQYVYSVLNREVEGDVLPRCEELGLGLLAYSPLGQGVLTGKYGGGAIPPGSRAADERLRRGMWEWKPEQIRRVTHLQPIADELGMSIAALALAWCLRQSAVASVLTGATRPEHVQENARASGVRLSADVLARMEAL